MGDGFVKGGQFGAPNVGKMARTMAAARDDTSNGLTPCVLQKIGPENRALWDAYEAALKDPKTRHNINLFVSVFGIQTYARDAHLEKFVFGESHLLIEGADTSGFNVLLPKADMLAEKIILERDGGADEILYYGPCDDTPKAP